MAERPDETAAYPDHPGELPGRTWIDTLKRAAKEFQNDNLTDWAAALTYYGVLALFPALIVLVSLLGLFGQYPQTFDALIGIVRQLGPGSAVDTLRGTIAGVVRNNAAAGTLLGVGTLSALWSASGYVGAFIRASNAVYEVEEGRPFWKLRPLQIGVTVLMLLLITATGVALVVSGPLLRAVGRTIGVGNTFIDVFSIAKWPIAVLIVALMFAFLYYIAPNVRQPRFRWITPGGALAVVAWALCSVAFAFYVGNFGSYNKTYGTLGGIVVFLLWLWLSNLALLFGLELDAELERARELEAGLPAEKEIQLPPRQAAKTS